MSSFGSHTPFSLLAKLKLKEDKVAEYLEIDIFWQGKGLNENAIDKTTGNKIVKTDRKFFRQNKWDKQNTIIYVKKSLLRKKIIKTRKINFKDNLNSNVKLDSP